MMNISLPLFGLFAICALATSSPSSLNSDVEILVNNDLQGPSSQEATSGVILLEAQSLKDAQASCAALGEQLWAPELKTASVQSNLDYLVYQQGVSDSSQFWISPSSSAARSINVNGVVSRANPSTKLAVLCTQSAPYSNITTQDSSSRWQISVPSNNETLVGFRDRYTFRFLGIRYAPQPERFTYSVPYVGSGGNTDATQYGSECVQPSSAASEDCLFLNIWTTYLPRSGATSKSLKPVMFWIHGGAFESGTGNDPTTDGGNLASRGDVVVVGINYRLSTLGFLALPDGKTNGNFGLADQINALNWVRENIQNFGGDPNKITIYGQSAGAGSVRALMASPVAYGKFAGAIPLSNLGGLNYGTTYSQYYTIQEEMSAAGDAILEEFGCTNATSQVDCLRSVPAFDLVTAQAIARYLVVDGTYLTSDRLQLTGPTLPIHLMMGIMRDDGAPFIGYPQTTNETAYLASIGFDVPPANLFPIPDIANQTLALYEMASELATDGIFRCIDQATVYAGLKTGRLQPTYFYEFNRSYQTTGWPELDVCEPPKTATHPYGDPDAEYLKCHSGELYYVFGNIARQGLPFRDENDLPFEQFTTDTFASFARTYDPNPDVGFLKARGYQSTLEELSRAGTWTPSIASSMTKRTLQWPSFQGPFTEIPQCDSLGLGLDYYLK